MIKERIYILNFAFFKMQSAINKIFLGINEGIHDEFIKYSKGVFASKYLVDAKKKKDGWKIKTSNEFTNFLVRSCLEKVKEVEVTGAIIATFDVSKEAEFPITGMKQFMGIKQAIVNTKTTSDKIIRLMDRFPRAFYALSFAGEGFKLKIKAKAPKSAKPSTSGDKEAKAEFCAIETSDQGIVKDLLFDCLDAGEVTINHQLVIEQIILPKNEKDPVKLRENAIRKGKMIRVLKIGEKEIKKEAAFEA
jgi:hypothetical protein